MTRKIIKMVSPFCCHPIHFDDHSFGPDSSGRDGRAAPGADKHAEERRTLRTAATDRPAIPATSSTKLQKIGNMTKKTSLTALSLSLLAACAADQKASRLEDTLRLYDKSIRWGQFSQTELLKERREDAFDYTPLRDIKVISIHPIRELLSETKDRFERSIEIEYIHDTESRVRTLVDNQVWRYDPERELWLLQGGIPDFK